MFLYNVKIMHYFAVCNYISSIRPKVKNCRKVGGESFNKLPVSKIGNKYPERKCSLYFGHFASWKRIRRAVLLVVD